MTRSRYRVASAPQALRYPLPSRPVAVRLRLVDSQAGCRIVVGQVLAVRPLEQTAHGSEEMLGLKRVAAKRFARVAVAVAERRGLPHGADACDQGRHPLSRLCVATVPAWRGQDGEGRIC